MSLSSNKINGKEFTHVWPNSADGLKVLDGPGKMKLPGGKGEQVSVQTTGPKLNAKAPRMK